MSVEHVLLFNLTLLGAWISPGPAFLIFLRNTLAGGRRAGVLTGLGLATMATIWTGAAFVGLAGLFTLVPAAYLVLKFAGAAYLIWIAWKTWTSADKPIGAVRRPDGHALASGFLVNLSNPKSVLFSASVLLVIFPPDLSVAAKSFVLMNHFVMELALYSTCAMLLATRRVSDGYLRLKSVFDRIAAGVLGVLGLRLLVDR